MCRCIFFRVHSYTFSFKRCPNILGDISFKIRKFLMRNFKKTNKSTFFVRFEISTI